MGVITRVQLLGGTAPLKFGSVKNVQNLVRFTTIFEFDCKYLWNWWRQRQKLNGVDESDLFGVEQIKFCEIRSTKNKVISAHVDLPQVDNARSAYANAFEFGPRDFDAGKIPL